METLELLRLIIEIAGLVFSVAALADVLWSHNRTKITLAIATASLVLLSSLAVFLSWQHRRRVERVSEEILSSIGPDVKTFDQIFQSLFQPEFPVANEAMGNLIGEKKLGYKHLELYDDQHVEYTTTGFYRITN